MNRLTEIKTDEIGHKKVYYKHKHLDIKTPTEISEFGSWTITDIIYDLLVKLAAYEDTGLEPEEINNLKHSKLMEVVAANEMLDKENKRLRIALKNKCDEINRISSQIHVKTGFEI